MMTHRVERRNCHSRRSGILELLLRDHSNDALIDSPELYSTANDRAEWLVQLDRRYWNHKINRCGRNFFRCSSQSTRQLFNADIARFWRALLAARPEFAGHCPWRFFQGDCIWRALQDESFHQALKMTPEELAGKFNLNTLSQPDWDEVLKVAPALASLRPHP